jgi:DNA mismatch repair protein MutS
VNEGVRPAARFHSILFSERPAASRAEIRTAPDFFRDLHLDRLVAAISAGWKDYDLEPFFYAPLATVDEIRYRQDVLRDLENAVLMQAVTTFAARMRTMRGYLNASRHGHYKYEKERWFLEAASLYREAIERLQQELQPMALLSAGMRGFRDYLSEYVASTSFGALATQTRQRMLELSALRFNLLIRDDRVTVYDASGETDYSLAIEQTFERFRQGPVKDYSVKFKELQGMNHIDAQVVERVDWLNPAPFRALERFCTEHAQYPDSLITAFEREVHFYVAFLKQVAELRRAGLSFCYPQVSVECKEVSAQDAFDLVLAEQLIRDKTTVVCNAFFLSGPERIFVVSGPNQGGKTTFARMFGQLHYLARLGCLVPGRRARLFLYDQIYTHFEREEDIRTQLGKLQDDLVRVRRIFDEATPKSIVIMNEIFASTTLADAVFLSKEMMGRIATLDLLCVWVTFLDELASFNEKTVSLVASADARQPAARTFKLERRPADGLAFALAIAEKYRVTYHWLKQRVKG